MNKPFIYISEFVPICREKKMFSITQSRPNNTDTVMDDSPMIRRLTLKQLKAWNLPTNSGQIQLGYTIQVFWKFILKKERYEKGNIKRQISKNTFQNTQRYTESSGRNDLVINL